MKIEWLNTHVPVTAVSFLQVSNAEYLISGGGSFVSVFDLESLNLVSVINVLGSRNIHGFGVLASDAVNGEDVKICAFGERFVALFDLNNDIFISKKVSKNPHVFHDRVMDVRWLNQNMLAVLLAHNELQVVNSTGGERLLSSKCEQNSILFSGAIVNTPSTTFVVAGACLGYLYIWQPFGCQHKIREDTRNDQANKDISMQVNLSNAGGVFCIAMKDDQHSLAIATEDRAIYTFFVDTSSNGRIDRLKTLFGHSARIWKVCWTEDNLVSAGEDCQILIWNLLDCSVMYRFESSSNTNFFSLAVDTLKPTRIAAGLSDGSVRLYNAKQLVNEGEILTERPGDDPSFKISESSEHVIAFRFVDADNAIYVSNKGNINVVEYRQPSLNQPSMSVLDSNPRYGISVHISVAPTSDPDKFLVALAHGVPSVVTIFELSKKRKWNLTKLAETDCLKTMPRAYIMSWLSPQQPRTVVPLFISNWDKAENCIFDVDGKVLLEFNLSNAKLPESAAALKHFDKIAITCGLYLNGCDQNYFYYVFGDNYGSIWVTEQLTKLANKTAIFTQVFPHVHGKEGCHSLTFSRSGNLAISCGGSSSVLFFSVEPTKRDGPLSLVNSITSGSSIDYTLACFIESTQKKEILCGFTQKSFMASVVRPSQTTICKHYCSGRKREWDLFIDDSRTTIRFGYIRQGHVFLVPASVPTKAASSANEVELQSKLHGLRIHDCQFICYLPKKDVLLFAMVSEDAAVSIVAFENQKTLKVLHRLSGHISGVRCVKVVEQPNTNGLKRRFLVFSGGSRGIVIAWALTIFDGVGDDLAFCKKLAQLALTNEPIDTFEKDNDGSSSGPKSSWRQRKIFGPPLAPDMRFMDLTVIFENSSKIFVAVGCSDATVRIFEFINEKDESSKFNRILCVSDGLKFCQLSITNSTGLLVSGDTGGSLNAFQWSELMSSEEAIKPQSFRVHQSGVNALKLGRANDVENSVLAFTGGDDTALIVSKISITASKQLDYQTLLRIESAHSSQISGLAFSNVSNLICTVSIDQRVRLWSFARTQPNNGQLLASVVSCVADASSIVTATTTITEECDENNNLLVLVAGEGCQLLKVCNLNKSITPTS